MPPPLEAAEPSESCPPQRDDFPAKVRTVLAQRVGWLCSNPDCQRSTIGPRMGEPGANNVGVGAHIKAASPGFARWDATQTKEERKSFHNGIWLCQTHAHQIDYDEQHFTVALLKKWKAEAEGRAFEQLASGEGPARIERLSQDLRAELASLRSDLGLPQDDDLDRVKARALVSATNHLQSFVDLDGWPQHVVPLLFQNRAKATGPTYNVDRLAEAFQSSGELALIAPPGTGKTTAMVGIARALLTAAGPIPLIVPLQEWAESSLDFLGWLANRQWFASLTANHLRFLAHHGEASLVLDGWNEIPSDARRRAMTEIKGLRRDLPLLSIALSTRPQVLDVPLDGPGVGVLPLNRAQQRELAQAVSGENGLSTLGRARAIRGLRDLMATPLYLATLLRTATDGRLPETREEILRSFVSAHEADHIRAEVLHRELSDQHASYLVALAVDAHTSGNTAISSATATIAVGRTNAELIATYQVQTPPNPAHVLDVLVNTHALQTDSGYTYEFQHHQFQEWYASKAIERDLLAHGDAPLALTDPFVTGRVNDRRWEESILFACERMSRENASAIVAHVVLVALELDPMLAAAIIRRSAEAVWNAVSASVLAWARRWHAPPNADRAITFMIETGRPEFADLVWPVVTNVNSQLRLTALRGGGRFDIAILGHHLDRDFSGLTEEIRESLISELIHSGGIEEEEKAAALAGRDPSAEVRVRAIESLLFEGAIEAAETLLRSSWNDTADAIARRGYTDELNDPDLIQRIEGLRRSAFDQEADPLRKASMALNYLPIYQQGEVIERLLSDPSIDLRADQGRMIAEIAGRHPDVVDRALRNRVEQGLELPWRFEEDYLIYGRTVDDGPVHALVTREDLNSDASRNAATLAGPKLVKTLCDRYLATYCAFRVTGVRTEAAYAPVKHVADVIGRVLREVLFSVVATYAGIEDAEDIRVLANLLSSQQDRRRPDPVSQVTLDALAECLDTWAQRLLSAAPPDRNALGELAGTMKRFPHPSHVPILRHMLSADLALHQADIERFRAEPNNQALRQRMQMSYAWSYRDALSLVGTPEAEAVLSSFLLDDRFGPDAAVGLVHLAVPGTSTGPFTSRNNRERANTNRLRRAADPAATSPTGQTIFEAVRKVFGQGQNPENLLRAASIAALGVLILHGEQSDILEGLLHADLGTRTRLSLLNNMGEGGYVLRTDDINAGLRELLDLAATEPWQLGNDHFVLRQWLALYAFSDRPRDLLPAIAGLPNTVRFPVWSVRDLLPTLKSIAPADLSAILIGLVQRMPELRAQHEFYDATLMLSVREIFSVLEATAGPRGAADLNGAAWDYTDKIAPQLSETDIEWLKQRFADASSPTRRLQAQILAARGTEEIFLFLAADPLGRDVVLRSRAMRMSNFATTVVSESTPDAGFVTREVQPADCSTLRRELFHMAIGQDAAQATFGRECLTHLDSLRDEEGTVETEPRHPDISAGQPWPLVPLTAA